MFVLILVVYYFFWVLRLGIVFFSLGKCKLRSVGFVFGVFFLLGCLVVLGSFFIYLGLLRIVSIIFFDLYV